MSEMKNGDGGTNSFSILKTARSPEIKQPILTA